jgi:DNA damage-inducible protein 1
MQLVVFSGAQRTIMSSDCAKRCNVSRFLDKRFQGFAVGVGGQQKILGRVHMGEYRCIHFIFTEAVVSAQIQIEEEFLPMSFDVLEDQSMDVLLGLDMLKRHQCMIDLKDNCLRIGEHTTTRFLHENELPAHARLNGEAKSGGTQEQEDRDLAEAMDASANDAPSSSSKPQNPAKDAKVQQLMDMGFSEVEAAAELVNCAGDVNQAAVKLLAKKLPAPK